MAKYLVETYYNCSFKVSHYLDDVNGEELKKLEKYDWQKPHQSNQTGTSNSYHPKKNNNAIGKKYKSWNS